MTGLEKASVARDMPAPPLLEQQLANLFPALSCGALSVILPNGRRLELRGPAPGPHGTFMLLRWRALRRMLLGGHLGFGEAFVDGDWSSPNLPALLELAALNPSLSNSTGRGTWLLRFLRRLLHRSRANTLRGSRRNIAAHYDLGNSFYARWLDHGMQYSSALFDRPGMSLEEAQQSKLDCALGLLDVKPGDRILELGCGWGAMAERLAAAGCRVTALTLSRAQLDYAAARLGKSDFASTVDVRLQDYREVGGEYDRVVCIEMLEAVGEARWPLFIECLRSRLKSEGTALLQCITIADDRFKAYRRDVDFIQKHIFPGGMLPSRLRLQQLIQDAGLELQHEQSFGVSYAETLRLWRERFRAAWPEIASSFGARFKRLWVYYLSYCEAGFRAGTIDVSLLLLGRRQ